MADCLCFKGTLPRTSEIFPQACNPPVMYSLGPELFLLPAVQFQMQTHPWGGSSLSVTEHFQGGRFPDPSFSWPGLGSLWGLESSQPPQKTPCRPLTVTEDSEPSGWWPHSSACPGGPHIKGPLHSWGAAAQ